MSGEADNASGGRPEGRTGDSAPETKRRLAGWRRPEVAAQLVGVVLGAVLGSVGTLVTTWWLAKAPHLSYVIGEAFPFKGDNEHMTIYHISIANDGSAQAEDVRAVIQLPGAKIDRVKITPSWLQPEYKHEKDGIQVSVPSINPNNDETVQVALVANATSGLPDKPTVVVRGKGINGEMLRRNPGGTGRIGIIDLIQLLAFIISIICVIIVFFVTKLSSEKTTVIYLRSDLRRMEGQLSAYEQGAERLRDERDGLRHERDELQAALERLREERDELQVALAKKARRAKPKADDAGQRSQPLPSAE